MSDQSRLRDRYAANPSPWSKIFAGIGVALFAALAVWLVWVIGLKTSPAVSSIMAKWNVVDDHTVSVQIQVDVADDAVSPRCRVRAYADDHVTVGEAMFVPVQGMNTVSIRTDRLATAVEEIGCTADGQKDPR